MKLGQLFLSYMYKSLFPQPMREHDSQLEYLQTTKKHQKKMLSH
jgi:hypothetical protein